MPDKRTLSEGPKGCWGAWRLGRLEAGSTLICEVGTSVIVLVLRPNINNSKSSQVD